MNTAPAVVGNTISDFYATFQSITKLVLPVFYDD